MRVLLTSLVFISVLSLGCKVIKPAVETTKTEETSFKFHPIDVVVSGAAVGTSLNLDSMYRSALIMRSQFIKDSINAALTGKVIAESPAKKHVITDPETKAQLTYWVDQYGKLQISCESKDQIVKVLVSEVTRLSKEVSKTTAVVKETPKWNWIIMSALATLLIISIIINLLKNKLR
jgi:hypothetical protein